jgi:transcriptional regulator with XRE-family HTH domain
MSIFLDRVERLRTDKKLSKSKILRYLGLNPNSFVNWEKRDNTASTPPPDSRRESIAAMIEPLSDDQLRDLLEYVRFLHWKESQKCQLT